MSVEEIKSTEQFEDSIKQDKVTICDFYATWCGPCMRIAPEIEKLAEKYPSVNFIKVDVDQHEDISMVQDIQAMPTFKAFKNGDCLDQVVGASLSKIEALIKKYE